MPDPFLRETPLELQSIYYPLGFPLHLQTNCPDILRAAEDSWGGRARSFDKPPLELQVDVQVGGPRPANPVYRGRQHLMIIVSDRDNFAACDYTRHFAYCRLNAAAAEDRPFAGYYFLEAIANYMLTQLYVTPIHAACVARQGEGMLLCGPSGAGKTSLAYFGALKGWTYVSDNESWLVRDRGLLVVGNPGRVRFREDASDLFPELAGKRAALHANGKMSIEAPTSGIETADQCCARHVVFLVRQSDGPSTVRGLEAEDALERFLWEIPIYEDRVRLEQRESLRAICGLDPIELRYSRLEDAWQRLESLVR